jgi:hypothetical protein
LARKTALAWRAKGGLNFSIGALRRILVAVASPGKETTQASERDRLFILKRREDVIGPLDLGPDVSSS